MARFHEKLKNDMYKAMVYQKKRLQEGGTSLENFLYCPDPPRISFHLRKVALLLKTIFFALKSKVEKFRINGTFSRFFL